MEKVLGRKQSIRNEDWIEVFEKIEKLVSKEEIDVLVESTIQEIREVTRGKHSAYAWSAGKDSIVLGKICEMAGIKECMIAICELEYPEFISWVHEHEPEGLTVINTKQDIKWLSKHPDMLFPSDSKTASLWFKMIQHRAQAKYYKENNLDIIILGRRKIDGNYVGKGSNIYTDAKGITRYSPLANWGHEAILAFLHYYNLELPPIYGWEKGFLCGTHPWPARQHMESEEQGWKEVLAIDRKIVEAAADYFPKASDCLKEQNKN